MTENKEKWNFKPIVGLAVISLLICGLFFPLLVTGIAQVFFPYQANGEIVQLNGKADRVKSDSAKLSHCPSSSIQETTQPQE